MLRGSGLENGADIATTYPGSGTGITKMMITLTRNCLAWFFSSILILCGFVDRAKKRALRGDYILSIYFHNPSRKEFEKCIKWLLKNNFTFLNEYQLGEIAEGRMPFPKGAVFLSVDDGWLSNELNVVEVAKKYRVPVTIFVSTEPVEEGVYWWTYINEAKKSDLEVPKKNSLKKIPNEQRLALINRLKEELVVDREALNIEQVRKISRTEEITIGGHTHTHPILPNCDEETVYRELTDSRKRLETWTGTAVTSFAYPNGDFGNREKAILRKLGYKLAFTNQPKYLTKKVLDDPYVIPRFGFLEGASFAENICRMVGLWQPIMRKSTYRLKSRKIIQTTPG